MKILITGATGLVGKKLLEKLITSGHDDIRVLTTNKTKALSSIVFPVDIKEWNPIKSTIEAGSLEDVDIIFHLAGENVASGKWTKKRKESILNSRVMGTQLLLDEIAKTSSKPKKFISSSAIGIYEKGFLAHVCTQWENTLFNHKIDSMQAHALRTGVVLSSEGGALKKMLLPFLLGAGGILGDGKQYMNWIHIDDLINAFIFLMNNNCKKQSYDAVAPSPVTNREFTKTLGKILKRPTIFPVPATVLKILFGEMSQILLEGQKVSSLSLQEEGFKFSFLELSEALKEIFYHHSKGEEAFERYQWVTTSKKEVFSFFSNEANLEKITPAYLNFKVLGKNTALIKSGTIIDYKLNIHGLPLSWKSQINTFIDGETFTDEQLKGPYAKWVHQHDFASLKDGTLIRDKVIYKIPLGIIGKICASYFIKKDINNIFSFRNKTVAKLL